MMKINPHIDTQNRHIPVQECRGCKLCRKQCRFLQEYGSPGDILKKYRKDPEKWRQIAFLCSLCHRCSAVCPRQYDPSRMFLEFRRQAVEHNQVDLSPFRPLLTYERLGFSQLFRHYYLPDGCGTTFFPGCALAGTHPAAVRRTFALLKKTEPDMGMILDCCLKPSHDLGRQAFFDRHFTALLHRLEKKRVQQIIVACPSCYAVFKEHAPHLNTRTAYELLARAGVKPVRTSVTSVAVHDACQTRFDPNIHQAVRDIIKRAGLSVAELPDNRINTCCCGEGAAAGFVSPELADSWTRGRLDAFKQTPTACYCAGCTQRFNKNAATFHLLDLFVAPEKALAKNSELPVSPFTYLNRLMLKLRLTAARYLKQTDLF
jgi:Fe-S oxidoreductase